MSKSKMDRAYFEQKKQYAIDGISHAQETVNDVKGLLSAWSYDLPDLINATDIHDVIRAGKAQLDGAMIDFEKTR